MAISSNATGYSIKPASNGVLVDLTGADVTFNPPVQLFVVTAGTISYDDNNGHLAQTPTGDFAAGVTTPFLVTKVYTGGATTAEIIAVY